jgi:uncharacterized protein (TIGR03083 family)
MLSVRLSVRRASMCRMTTALPPERYFQLIDRDTDRLIAMGERGLQEPVPSCPGWDVAEVVWHVAVVYEHKVRVMADNAWPDPWPPTWEFADDEELAFLRSAKTHLFEEFGRHDISEPSQTFGEDPTVGFWVRRMACEIAIHRYDGELAHGDTTPIDADLALDGVDEFLQVAFAGDSKGETEHPVDAVVAVECEGSRWRCDVTGDTVTVAMQADGEPGDGEPAGAGLADGEPADVVVSGAPEALFLWLWGRAADDRVRVEGDADVVRELRGRLVEAAQ